MTEMQETTVVDQRYDGLLNVIDTLKVQLIEEKQKNLKLDRKIEKVEKDVRAELCDEFNKMMVEIESGWEQRLQEEKDRASELSDWRINKMQEAYNEKSKKRKRSEGGEVLGLDNNDPTELETKKQRINELECILEEQKKENEQAKDQIEAMKNIHQKMLEDQQREQEKVTRQSFQMANQKKKFEEYEEQLSALRSELKATNEALEAQSAEPKIKELELQLEETRKAANELLRNKTELTTLLEEAGEEYQTKNEELSALRNQLLSMKVCKFIPYTAKYKGSA